MNEKISKEPNEKFCHECGAAINMKAEICPKCGVRQLGLSSISANSVLGVMAFFANVGLISSVFIGWSDAIRISHTYFMFILFVAAMSSIFSILSVALNKSVFMLGVFLSSMLIFLMVYGFVSVVGEVRSNFNNGLYIALASGVLMFICGFLSIISSLTKKE